MTDRDKATDAQAKVSISLRPATPEDRFRIRRWLAESDIAAWWGNAASAEAEINLAMSSESAICRIVECDDATIGYGHAVEIGAWNEAQPPDVPAGTWRIDLFVASAEHRGKGLGREALAALAEEVFATTLALACCGAVLIRNETAVRAYEQAGFRWQRIWHDRLAGPCWLLLKERPIRP
jgi:RimJ/RimL family protein N-acetyltransferase